jgi:hypothetical protein
MQKGCDRSSERYHLCMIEKLEACANGGAKLKPKPKPAPRKRRACKLPANAVAGPSQAKGKGRAKPSPANPSHAGPSRAPAPAPARAPVASSSSALRAPFGSGLPMLPPPGDIPAGHLSDNALALLCLEVSCAEALACAWDAHHVAVCRVVLTEVQEHYLKLLPARASGSGSATPAPPPDEGKGKAKAEAPSDRKGKGRTEPQGKEPAPSAPPSDDECDFEPWGGI